MRRRNLALRHDAMDALVFLALRCARCDSARLVAIEPGKQEDEPHGSCARCWPQSFSRVAA